MRRLSTRMFGIGLICICIGVSSLWQPNSTVEVSVDTSETTELLPQSTDTPTVESVQPRTTRTPLPVTILPTATTIIFPTARPISQDTVLLGDNIYRDTFMNTSSGWDFYYSGDGGAWNGYMSDGYAFQLAYDPQLSVGRRIWDFNTCCILESQYGVSFDAESQSPQRGMVITEYVGDYNNMSNASGIIVLFDVGYNMQPRAQPLQVVRLQQGFPTNPCIGGDSLVVGPRMKISVTVVDRMFTVTLLNRDNDESTSLRCGLAERSYERKRLGVGAVRLPNTTNAPLSPLIYTSMEIASINGYITDSVPEPFYGGITAGCDAQTVYDFEDWLSKDILLACPVY